MALPSNSLPPRQITVLRFDHMEFLAEVPLLEDLLPRYQGVKHAAAILAMRYAETLPSTTLKWMARYSRELQANGNLLLLSGVRPRVFEILAHTTALDAIGKENIFPDQGVLMEPLNQAMTRGREWLQQSSIADESEGV